MVLTTQVQDLVCGQVCPEAEAPAGLDFPAHTAERPQVGGGVPRAGRRPWPQVVSAEVGARGLFPRVRILGRWVTKGMCPLSRELGSQPPVSPRVLAGRGGGQVVGAGSTWSPYPVRPFLFPPTWPTHLSCCISRGLRWPFSPAGGGSTIRSSDTLNISRGYPTQSRAMGSS